MSDPTLRAKIDAALAHARALDPMRHRQYADATFDELLGSASAPRCRCPVAKVRAASPAALRHCLTCGLPVHALTPSVEEVGDGR